MGMESEQAAKAAAFERVINPQLDAAWNLTRWLMGNPHDAEDALQDASLRAFRSFADYRGGDPKSWFLTIVRNACHSAMQNRRRDARTAVLDDHSEVVDSRNAPPGEQVARDEEAGQLHRAIELLPPEYREALVLRELEEMNYKQIAEVLGVPLGTVMSRLARARERLAIILEAPCATKREPR